jgi:uncharacterized membrane protein YphA (DoxX/SURF4 family)
MSFHGFAGLVGQVLIGAFFVIAGVNQFFNLDQMKAYASAKKVPAAGIVIPIVATLLAISGFAILLDPVVGRDLLLYGAVIGAVSTLVITIIMHDFWRMATPDDHLMAVDGSDGEAAKMLPPQDNEIFHFIKNLALIGGVLLLLQ